MSPVSQQGAVSFGGLGKDSTPVADCAFFDYKDGWAAQIPAGTRPPRSAGQAAVYDAEAYQLLVNSPSPDNVEHARPSLTV